MYMHKLCAYLHIVMRLLFLLIFSYHFMFSAAENYGPFDVKINSIQNCTGPKTKECGSITYKILDGGKKIWVDLDLFEDYIPNKGRIQLYNTATKKQIMRMQLDNPCKHLFLRPTFEHLLNISSECVAKKGHYNNEVDIDGLAKKYYGGSFIYGNLTFKSAFYNNKCNMACCNIDVELFPI